MDWPQLATRIFIQTLLQTRLVGNSEDLCAMRRYDRYRRFSCPIANVSRDERVEATGLFSPALIFGVILNQGQLSGCTNLNGLRQTIPRSAPFNVIAGGLGSVRQQSQSRFSPEREEGV